MRGTHADLSGGQRRVAGPLDQLRPAGHRGRAEPLPVRPRPAHRPRGPGRHGSEGARRDRREGSRVRGSITLEGAAGMAGGALTAVAAVQTAATLHSAYQEGAQAHSYTPLAKATVHEAGSWGGGFAGGFLLGAAVGV